MNKTTVKDSAKFFQKLIWKDDKKEGCSEFIYRLDSSIYFEAHYSNYDSSDFVGVSRYYFKNNQVWSENHYDANGKILKYRQYYKNGNIKRIDNYENDKFISGILKSQDGKLLPYEAREVMPEFIGGEKKLYEYLAAKIKYPKKDRRKGISGEVLVEFIVCKDGSVCEFKIKQSVSKNIDKSVLDALKDMPKWKPAKNDGEPVRVQYTLPVGFYLD